jgi:hypothetical protein
MKPKLEKVQTTTPSGDVKMETFYGDASMLPSKIDLYPQEQDIEEEEQEDNYDEMLKDTKAIVRELKNVKKMIAPILFDIKDGTLKRVAPSRFQEKQDRFDSLSRRSDGD